MKYLNGLTGFPGLGIRTAYPPPLTRQSGAFALTVPARHNNDEVYYAVYDRVSVDDLEIIETSLFSDHRSLVDALLRRHGAAWDPASMLPDLSKLR